MSNIDNKESSSDDSITLSIRTKKEIAESFRDISSTENLSQGDFLEKLVTNYLENKTTSQKLLVKPLKNSLAKTIVFEGRIIYSIKLRKVINAHLESLISKNILVNYEETHNVRYKLDIYLSKKNKYLIYEEIGQVNDNNEALLNTFNYKVVDSSYEIGDKLKGKVFISEFNDILLLTSEQEILDI